MNRVRSRWQRNEGFGGPVLYCPVRRAADHHPANHSTAAPALTKAVEKPAAFCAVAATWGMPLAVVAPILHRWLDCLRVLRFFLATRA